MKTVLVVTVPFGDYAKGDQIEDAEAMEAALESHHAHVVRANPVEHPEPGGDAAPRSRAKARQPKT
jgi:hypothetical protein